MSLARSIIAFTPYKGSGTAISIKAFYCSVISVVLLLALVVSHASAQVVLNGDFSVNAIANFTHSPGYEGQTSGSSSGNGTIPDWTAAGNTEFGGTASGVNGSSGLADFDQFGPQSTHPNSGQPATQPGTFGFIQQNGPGQGTLTQNLVLAAHTTYVLTFEAGERAGDQGLAFGSVTVNAGGSALVVDGLSGVNSASFTTYTDVITTGANVASASIVLKNTGSVGDGRTVAFTNISITAVSSDTPVMTPLALRIMALLIFVVAAKFLVKSPEHSGS